MPGVVDTAVALRGSAVSFCSDQASYDRAYREWCGPQTEPYACYKPPTASNFIWDCHLVTAGPCTTNGHVCAWTRTGVPPTPAPAQAGPGDATPGHATRFLSWNVYYLGLNARAGGVAQGIAEVAPEIASLQEMWREKSAILQALIGITGQAWAFATGGATEVVWDGDILYRSDLWEHLESGMQAYGDRGLSWAALRRRSDGACVLAYGTHPTCCIGDLPVLQAAVMATRNMAARQRKYQFPVAFMGDLNIGYFAPSQTLLRTGTVNSYGRAWTVPLTFSDAYADKHPGNPNPSTIHNDPVRLDYVYFEKSPKTLGTIVGSQVWNLPGGSDHRAVSGDVVI